MNKIKSTKLTGFAMVRRDELKKKAYEVRECGEKEYARAQEEASSILRMAKEKVHAARIAANRMEREAQMIQEAIEEELELQVNQEKEAVQAWEVKSISHLKAENGLISILEEGNENETQE